MQDYLMIGVVLKPQGIRGEIKVKPYAADVSLFGEWKTLYLKENDAFSPVSCTVSRIHDGFVYAVLAGCKTADDAEKLRGKELYIDRAHAAKLEDGAVYITDLVGCTAVDETGRTVGVLTDVLQYGSVDTWVFRTAEGILMAPALKSVFPEVDIEKKTILAVRERLEEVAVRS